MRTESAARSPCGCPSSPRASRGHLLARHGSRSSQEVGLRGVWDPESGGGQALSLRAGLRVSCTCLCDLGPITCSLILAALLSPRDVQRTEFYPGHLARNQGLVMNALSPQ